MHRLLFAASAAALLASAPYVAQAQAPSYTVYFAFDSAELDQQARATIQDAIQSWRETGEAEVSIVGHADTSGDEEYNQRLSERRARAVEDAMLAQGVPVGAITTAGRGERDLAVQTGDGVREPENRRVVVALSGAPEPVVQAPPPAPMEPEERFLGLRFAIAPYLGVGLAESDYEGGTVWMPGLNLTASYDLTNNFNIEAEQAVFYTIGADDDGLGGRSVLGANFQTDFEGFNPYIGANVGAVYADGSFERSWFAGPEVGFRVGFLEAKLAYDMPFDRDLDEGIVSATVGALIRF